MNKLITLKTKTMKRLILIAMIAVVSACSKGDEYEHSYTEITEVVVFNETFNDGLYIDSNGRGLYIGTFVHDPSFRTEDRNITTSYEYELFINGELIEQQSSHMSYNYLQIHGASENGDNVWEVRFYSYIGYNNNYVNIEPGTQIKVIQIKTVFYDTTY